MAITAKDSGGSFTPAPVGTHPARCYMVLDLGHQKNEYQGETSIRHQVLIGWELPKHKMDDGRPISISKFYTLSLHEKSNLGKDLVSWRGRAFTEDEKQGFDVSKLLGVPAMLSIIDHNGKSRVGAVMGFPGEMVPDDAINTPVLFDMENFLNGDRVVFDSLSEGLQGIINRAQEIISPANQSETPSDFNDDIPF